MINDWLCLDLEVIYNFRRTEPGKRKSGQTEREMVAQKDRLTDRKRNGWTEGHMGIRKDRQKYRLTEG